MTEASSGTFGPVTGKARIEVLDILRGIAILGIIYMNMPFMAGYFWAMENDIRAMGWSVADRNTWIFIETVLAGTQRGLLELLFGAGLMIFAAKAMSPEGPVEVADLYIRRNLWLFLFGLADVFLLLWIGDILHVYALAALFLFPFRKLGPKALVTLAVAGNLFFIVPGALEYASRTQLVQTVETARGAQSAGQPLTAEQRTALADWQKHLERGQMDEAERRHDAAERKARHDEDLSGYASWTWSTWALLASKGMILFTVIEAFLTMLVGIALFKWGVIQGSRTAGFYLAITLMSYAIGFTIRGIGVAEQLSFMPWPKTIWFTNEIGRIAVTIGHVALINLVVKSVAGRAILSPFKAAGRTAFSLYCLTSFITVWIMFSPFGLDLAGSLSWKEQALVSTGLAIFLLILANLWLRAFAVGPLEWAWRSLTYWKRQPFRRVPPPVREPVPLPV